MVKCAHSSTFHSILIKFFISFTVLAIRFSTNCQMEGNMPTDIDMTFPFDIRLVCLQNAIFVKIGWKIKRRIISCDSIFSYFENISELLHTFVIGKIIKTCGSDEFFCRQEGLSWLWSYGSWIYNYLCNQCQPSLKLWVPTSFMAKCTRYNIMW